MPTHWVVFATGLAIFTMNAILLAVALTAVIAATLG